jgi:hypothetical protein
MHFLLPFPRSCSILISFLECAARLVRARRVNGGSPLLDVAYDSVFVDDEGRTASDEPLFVKDAVGLDHLSLHVAQQWECYSDVFLEAVVGSVAINTYADDLRVALLEVGNISLICLQFLRSTAGKSQHVKGERDVLLSTEIRELDGLSVRVGEGEIGRRVSDLKLRLRGARRLGGGGASISRA